MQDGELIAHWLHTLARLARASAHGVRGASGAMAIHAELLAGTVGAAGDGGLAERQRRYLAVLEVERHRLHQVAETYLMHVTVPDRRTAVFDLAELTAQAVALSRPYAEDCGASLGLDRPAGPVRATARPDVVRSALVDVLLEALDAPAPARRVGVMVGLTAGRACVSVSRPEAAPPPAEALLSDWRRMAESAGGVLRASRHADGGPCVTLEFSDTPEMSEEHA